MRGLIYGKWWKAQPCYGLDPICFWQIIHSALKNNVNNASKVTALTACHQGQHKSRLFCHVVCWGHSASFRWGQNSEKWLFIPFLGEHTTAHRRHQAVDKYFNWLVPDLVTLVCLLDESLKWHKPPPPTTYTFWLFKLRAPPASAWELGLYACSSTAQQIFS